MSCCGGYNHNKHGEQKPTEKNQQKQHSHHDKDHQDEKHHQQRAEGHNHGHVGGCCGGRSMWWILGILILVSLLYRLF